MTGDVFSRLQWRPAAEADLPFLLDLRVATMQAHLLASGAPVDEQSHRARIAYQFEHARILLLDGQPVGLLKVRRQAPVWEVLQIQLQPALGGQGLGRQLLEQVIAEAAAQGCPLELGVLHANPARRLYERLGFRVIGQDALEYRMHRALDA